MKLNVSARISKAESFEKKRKFADARAIYKAILEVYPNNKRAKVGIRGIDEKLRNPQREQVQPIVSLCQQGRWSEALGMCNELIELYPESDRLWALIGKSASHLKRGEMAISALVLAASINESEQNFDELAKEFVRQKDYKKAASWFRKARDLNPKNANYSMLCARIEILYENLPQAVRELEQYLSLEPNDANANALLGATFFELGNAEKSVAVLEKAVSLEPKNFQFSLDLGKAYFANRELDKSIEITKKAIELDPDSKDAKLGVADRFLVQEKHDDALPYFERILAEHDFCGYTASKVNFIHAVNCNWSEMIEPETLISKNSEMKRSLSPWEALFFIDKPSFQKECSKSFARQWDVKSPLHDVGSHEKIRVGYFTSDLRQHATMELLSGVLRSHDKSKFDIYLYSLRKSNDDKIAQDAVSYASLFRKLDHMGDQEAYRVVTEDHLDIAVDLKGYTRDARTKLFFERVAPIQVNFLGYPGTMGTACMDYLVADQNVIPEFCRPHYSEKILYMPDSYQPNDNTRKIALSSKERADHGLPAEGFVFCAFNQLQKITPLVFDVWMRLLEKCPGSVLWLLEGSPAAERNLRREAEQRGVDSDRLIFAKRVENSEHLARHKHADLFLDTFVCNAHTTASDALWSGLPVLTMAGQQFAARVAASLLNAVHLPELIAETPEIYEEKALEYFRDRNKLAQLKEELSTDISEKPLYDSLRFTRNLEAGYRMMFEAKRSGQDLEDIFVTWLKKSRPAGAHVGLCP